MKMKVKTRKNHRNTILLSFCFVLCLAIGCGGGMYLTQFKQLKTKVADTSMVQNLVIDSTAESMDDLSQETNEAIDLHLVGIPEGTLEKDTPLYLQNPKENTDIYFEYTVLNENGDVLYQSDLIQPGKAIAWIPGEKLTPGEHSLMFITQPYYWLEPKNEWTPLTTGKNSVVLTILE